MNQVTIILGKAKNGTAIRVHPKVELVYSENDTLIEVVVNDYKELREFNKVVSKSFDIEE